MAAKGPGLVPGCIAKQKDFLPCCFHFEIVMAQRCRVQIPFIPSVQDLGDFKPLSQMNKNPRAFLSFVAGVTLDFNLFKDPLFSHNFSPQRHRGHGEELEFRQKYGFSGIRFCEFLILDDFILSFSPCPLGLRGENFFERF